MQRFTPRGLKLIFFLAGLLVILTTLAVVPSLRNAIRAKLLDQNRIILAKTSGYITPEGPFVTVFKIREGNMLSLEIYTSPDEDGNPRLLQKIGLDEMKDGYFNFQGNATNLAMSDTDHDGSMDLISPSFDGQATPRLLVYRFNKSLQVFEKAPPSEPTH